MEVNAKVEQPKTQTEISVEENLPDFKTELNEALEKINQLVATNDRILNESKEYKTKFQGLKNEISDSEKAQLEKSGDLQGLLEKSQNENFELKKNLQSEKDSNISQSLKFEVAKLTGDAHDIDDVISNLSSDGIDYDGEARAFTGLKEAIEKVRENKKYLFKTEVETKMVSSVPNGTMQKPIQKTIGQMNSLEKSSALTGLLTKVLKKG